MAEVERHPKKAGTATIVAMSGCVPETRLHSPLEETTQSDGQPKGEGEGFFFFEKKKQKTFANAAGIWLKRESRTNP